MADFSDILNKKPSEQEPPKPLPAGIYNMTVVSFENTTRGEKQTPVCLIHLQPVEAVEVDDDEMTEFGDLSEGKMTAQMWLTEASLYRFTEFLEQCGLDVDSYTTFSEALNDLPGCTVQVEVSHRVIDPESGRVFAEPKKFAAV